MAGKLSDITQWLNWTRLTRWTIEVGWDPHWTLLCLAQYISNPILLQHCILHVGVTSDPLLNQDNKLCCCFLDCLQVINSSLTVNGKHSLISNETFLTEIVDKEAIYSVWIFFAEALKAYPHRWRWRWCRSYLEVLHSFLGCGLCVFLACVPLSEVANELSCIKMSGWH